MLEGCPSFVHPGVFMGQHVRPSGRCGDQPLIDARELWRSCSLRDTRMVRMVRLEASPLTPHEREVSMHIFKLRIRPRKLHKS